MDLILLYLLNVDRSTYRSYSPIVFLIKSLTKWLLALFLFTVMDYLLMFLQGLQLRWWIANSWVIFVLLLFMLFALSSTMYPQAKSRDAQQLKKQVLDVVGASDFFWWTCNKKHERRSNSKNLPTHTKYWTHFGDLQLFHRSNEIMTNDIRNLEIITLSSTSIPPLAVKAQPPDTRIMSICRLTGHQLPVH